MIHNTLYFFLFRILPYTRWIFTGLAIIITGGCQFYYLHARTLRNLYMIYLSYVMFGALFSYALSNDSPVYLLLIVILSWIVSGLLYCIIPQKKIPTKQNIYFEFSINGGSLKISNPFRGICVLGGTGSGKTLSIIKPIIFQLAQKGFTGIIYDYKKFDLTRCAFNHYLHSSVNLRLVNFFDLDYSHRVNPLSPGLLESPAYASEAANVLFTNLSYDGFKNGNESYFSEAAEAALSSVIWRLKEDFPDYCNLPMAISICLNQDYNKIASFISRNKQAALTGSTYIQSLVNPKQAVGVVSTISSALRKLAVPEIYYVLSGSDFTLDLNNPDCPTLLCISNNQKLDKSFSPVIALLINMAIKELNTEGKQQSVILLDEAATLRIPGLDNVPATARENRIVSILCFQDLVQGEFLYGRIGRDKLIANLANQFLGRVVEPSTAERYSKVFGKVERPYTSQTRKSCGWSGKSYTTSLRDVDILRPQVFMHLKPGEFHGILAEGGNETFHVFLKPYKMKDRSLPVIRRITLAHIKSQFENILSKANWLIEQ